MNLPAVFASLTLALLLLLTPGKAIAVDLVSHAPRSAQAYIIQPADGARVPETFTYFRAGRTHSAFSARQLSTCPAR